MNRTSVAAFVLASLLVLVLAATTQQSEAQYSGSVTIKADGTVDPADAPIQRVGNTYTLTGNCNRIVVTSSDIILDGNGYTPTGAGVTFAVYLGSVKNVTVKNILITKSEVGIFLDQSSNCTIVNNTITGTRVALPEYQANGGIVIRGGNFNIITGNDVENNMLGIVLLGAEHNVIVDNNITGNTVHGLEIGGSSSNTIYRNRFINNKVQIYAIPWQFSSFNTWDDGSQGNYWSDYNGTDADGNNIGDTPFVIDENNQDNYPLIAPYAEPKVPGEENPSDAAALIAASAAVAVATALGAAALFYFNRRRRQTSNNTAQQTRASQRNSKT